MTKTMLPGLIATFALLSGAPAHPQSAPVPNRVKNINPRTMGSNPMPGVVVGTTAYFVANDGISGDEIWKSDGSPAGTQLLKDISPASLPFVPSFLTATASTLYFVARDENGPAIWKSNGTAAGTVMVKNFPSMPSPSFPTSLTAAGNTLYFFVNDG